MTKLIAAVFLAIGLSACVSTADQRVPDTPDTPKIRKAIAEIFMRSLGHHWILGDLPLRKPVIAGPYEARGIVTGVPVHSYCIGTFWQQGPFLRSLEAIATVVQEGTKVEVQVQQSRGFNCQGQPAPFRELAELVAQKTGVPIETVLNPPPPPIPF